MKFKIAYIDESDAWLQTVYQTLKNEFEVLRIKVDAESSVEKIVAKLFQSELDAIITDYLLEEEGDVSL